MTLRPSDRAWIILAVGVAAWDWLAPDDELLSEAADRYMLAHPWLTRAVVIAVGAHLCNMVPDRWDPLHRLFGAKRLIARS